MFDFAVIGKGLIGAACARHLSESSGSIALIGPPEPLNWADHNGVFASHYDSGRITRILDTDPVWAQLAKRSIERYRTIERASGIEFFHPVGCMKVAPDTDWGARYIAANEGTGKKLAVAFEIFDGRTLKDRYPYMECGDHVAILESGTAGWIDPRKLVRAQVEIAHNAGVTAIDETVIERSVGAGFVSLTTDTGRKIETKKVIVAAGGFSNFNNLVDRNLKLTVRAETTLLARIAPHQLVELSSMPSVIYFLEGEPNLHYVYMVPPVVYPDGHTYLKIGGDREVDHVFTDLNALQAWFHSDGGTQAAAHFKKIMLQLFPHLQATAWLSKPCIITDTATERPYIGVIDEHTIIATGGCGAAAKSSDELGRLAALCAQGQSDPAYDADDFSVVFEHDESIRDTQRQFHF